MLHTVPRCPDVPQFEGGQAACVFQNKDLLQVLLHMNNTGVFNASTIAQALEHMDIAGGLNIRLGRNWCVEHG